MLCILCALQRGPRHSTRGLLVPAFVIVSIMNMWYSLENEDTGWILLITLCSKVSSNCRSRTKWSMGRCSSKMAYLSELDESSSQFPFTVKVCFLDILKFICTHNARDDHHPASRYQPGVKGSGGNIRTVSHLSWSVLLFLAISQSRDRNKSSIAGRRVCERPFHETTKCWCIL